MELYRNILLAVCIVIAYFVIGALLKILLVILAAFALTVKEKWDNFRRR